MEGVVDSFAGWEGQVVWEGREANHICIAAVCCKLSKPEKSASATRKEGWTSPRASAGSTVCLESSDLELLHGACVSQEPKKMLFFDACAL